MAIAVWTSEADADLDQIYLYIARQDKRPKVAAKVVGDIYRHCNNYACSFHAGHATGTKRPELGKDYRVFAHQRWVIVFRPLADTIEVIRVVDGSRDYGKLFGN